MQWGQLRPSQWGQFELTSPTRRRLRWNLSYRNLDSETRLTILTAFRQLLPKPSHEDLFDLMLAAAVLLPAISGD